MQYTPSFVLRACTAVAMAMSLQAPVHAAEAKLVDVATAALGFGYTEVTSASFLSAMNALPGPFTFELLYEGTKWADTQTFSVNGNVLFNGAAAAGATGTASTVTSILFKSNSGDAQQYAPYGLKAAVKYLQSSDGQAFVVAYEDWAPSKGAMDFNDAIVKVSASAVPEPESLALLLAGVGVVGFLGRQRRIA